MHVVFVFIDGIGLGRDDPAVNPFAACSLPAFETLSGGQPWTASLAPIVSPHHVVLPLDATLGVEGLPQSGTGQTALFTGRNAARVAGRHYGPYPHSRTRALLAESNLFARLNRLDLPFEEAGGFANAYPPRFFEIAAERDRWTVTTRCCLDAGVRLRTVDDVRAGRALTAELTGDAWQERLHIDVPILTEQEAGQRLLFLAEEHAVLLFEYYLTDKAGHSQSWERALDVLNALDRFFEGVLARLDPARHLLLVSSDHGNLEDMSIRTHTRHPVPLVAYGAHAGTLAGARSLMDVTPKLIEAVRNAYGAVPKAPND